MCCMYESVATSTCSMRPWSMPGAAASSCLDLLLGGVGELAAFAVEELDAVVLGRVVRGRDDDAEVEREQRDGGRRQHAAEDAVAAGRDDAARERLLELDARGARVAADEDLRRARPERRRAAEPLDELGRQELAHDAADTIGAEVPPSHERRIYRLLNCGALRALCRPAFLRSTTRASRVRKPARFSGARKLGVDLDERTGDPVAHRAGLARRAAAVQANAEVVLTLEPGRLQRRGREHPVHLPREVLLDRLAVDPRRAVAGAKDHARDGRLALAGAEILGRSRHLHLERWSVPAPRADAPGRRRSSAWSVAARPSLLRGSMPLTALRSTSVGCRSSCSRSVRSRRPPGYPECL